MKSMKWMEGINMKGFTCEIIKSRYHSPNEGLSSKASEVTIIDDAVPAMYEPSEKAPAVKLVRRTIGGRPYIHAEPIEEPGKGFNGWMDGGSYIDSSDSRFPNDYPIPLHDRKEAVS